MVTLTSRLFLDTRHQKKDGTYPIKLRINIDRKHFEMSLGFSVGEADWSAKDATVKTRSKAVSNVTRLNNLLTKEKTKAMESVMKLAEDGHLATMPLKDVRNHVLGKGPTSGVYTFFEDVVLDMKRSERVGNARVYQMVLNSVRNFAGTRDFPIKQITYRWLQKYEAWYLGSSNDKGKPNTRGGLSVNLRTLRALYNKAIKSRLVSKDSYPFADYKIASVKTRKRAIGMDDIIKIKNLDDELLTKRQLLAQDYFLMSFYLMGISFVDLAFLRPEDIVEGRVEYTRRKTGQLHSIKITPPLRELLDKFYDGRDEQETILGVVTGRTEERRYTAARDELRRYNRSLKQLAQMAGIASPVTSYTARHSYATIAKSKNVPVAVISEALGHETIEMTQTYLAEFETEVLDQYNELIIAM